MSPLPDVVEPSTSLPPWRRVAGTAVTAVAVVLAVLFALGARNPWELVILKQYFANPWLGASAVAGSAYLAMWLLLPISYEALQFGRIRARVAVAVIGGLGLVVGLNLHPLFRYEASVLDREGGRTIAFVISGGLLERELKVWQGSGLLAREVGSLGRPCGGFQARFVDRDTVLVNQGYGDWLFALDPGTGRPLQVLAPRCPVGPIPAP